MVIVGPTTFAAGPHLSTEMMRLRRMREWSQLTILLVICRAFCRHENQNEGRAGGALSHVWRQAGRKVRTQHRPAPDRTASRSAFGSLGKVSRAKPQATIVER